MQWLVVSGEQLKTKQGSKEAGRQGKPESGEGVAS